MHGSVEPGVQMSSRVVAVHACVCVVEGVLVDWCFIWTFVWTLADVVPPDYVDIVQQYASGHYLDLFALNV